MLGSPALEFWLTPAQESEAPVPVFSVKECRLGMKLLYHFFSGFLEESDGPKVVKEEGNVSGGGDAEVLGRDFLPVLSLGHIHDSEGLYGQNCFSISPSQSV